MNTVGLDQLLSRHSSGGRGGWGGLTMAAGDPPQSCVWICGSASELDLELWLSRVCQACVAPTWAAIRPGGPSDQGGRGGGPSVLAGWTGWSVEEQKWDV